MLTERFKGNTEVRHAGFAWFFWSQEHLSDPYWLFINCQVVKLRDQLELKLAVLNLPLEICITKAVRGSSALQASLEEVLGVIQEVEKLEDQLRNQEINLVRAVGTAVAMRMICIPHSILCKA